MMVLITYDVNAQCSVGQKRLRRVAKICVDYGQRVQNSVFECMLSPAQFVEVKGKITAQIDNGKDSVRFYLMGKNWERRIETLGKHTEYHPKKDAFIF